MEEGVRHGCGLGDVGTLFSSMVSWVTGLLASDCVQKLRQINVILSRHSEFEKDQTNSGNMKMERSGLAELCQSNQI